MCEGILTCVAEVSQSATSIVRFASLSIAKIKGDNVKLFPKSTIV